MQLLRCIFFFIDRKSGRGNTATMDGKINIREIARELGCSPSTVSRVLSGHDGRIRIGEKTRRRILDYCAQRDYRPSIHAGRFFSRRSRTIGFLSDGGLTGDDTNLSRSLFTVCRELFERGYRCLPLLNSGSFVETREFLEIFKRCEIDALLVWGASESCGYLREVQEAGEPFLLLGNRFLDFPAVYVNQFRPAFELASHCRGQGAGRFVILNYPVGDSYLQRQAGFEAALAGCEIKFIASEQNRRRGYELVPEIMSYAPDAVLCGNDDTAIGVERGLLELGVKIPGDILLTGGDNIPGADYCPVPLSSFDLRAEESAVAAVAMLVDHLDHGGAIESKVLESEIFYRQSSLKNGSVPPRCRENDR